jgi:hypothetical protein
MEIETMMKKLLMLLVALSCYVGMQAQDVTGGGNGLKRGFRGIAELGYEVATNKDGENSPILNLSAGYQLNPYIFLGAGVGLRHYKDNDKNSVPIFFNFRSDFVNAKINPFVDVKLGFSPSYTRGFGSAGMGCRFKIGKKCGLLVSAGFEVQDLENKGDHSEECGIYLDYMLGTFLKVGIDF